MATLEDAAEQLVVKLKGLDSEIEESRHALEDMRERMGVATKELDAEWAALVEAVSAFTGRLREERESLAGETREGLQATNDARDAVDACGAEARSRIAGEAEGLEALARHATALQPAVESLVSEAGEAPATHLEERAREVEEQLAAALQEACAFLRDDVAVSLAQLSDEVRESCRDLRERMTDLATDRLGELYDEWETSVDGLEDYVTASAFEASRGHAHAVVEWALAECGSRLEERLAALEGLMAEAAQPLEELGRTLSGAVEGLASGGGDLKGRLTATEGCATRAVQRLDAVKALLASFSFVGA